MKQLADGVWMLRGFPPNAINVYLADDILIDAATRLAKWRILRQLAGRAVHAHALTHVHPDHQGSSHAICEQLRIPLWCGEHDAPAMEVPGSVIASDKIPRWYASFQERFWVGPPHPVARTLRESDEVASFQVLDTPGHSRGHVAYWRESDRTLIAGDAINNMNVMTGAPGLHEPPDMFNSDSAQNRASIRRLAALEPALVVFGHGPPLRDPAKLAAFAARLPA